MNRRNIRFGVRVLLAVFFIIAGVLHFTHTGFYLTIMPPYLPFHRALVLISGFFEIVGGIGLIVLRLTRAAGYGLIALLVAVFPANIYMAMNNLHVGDSSFSPALLWLRLPLQFVLIALVWWCTNPDSQSTQQFTTKDTKDREV